MPRTARPVDPLPQQILEDAATDFMRCALAALQGQIPNQRELADRLGWPETTLSSSLQGRFTFSTWPKICRALGRDPIDELTRGRAELRKAKDDQRADAYLRMLERAEADTMVALEEAPGRRAGAGTPAPERNPSIGGWPLKLRAYVVSRMRFTPKIASRGNFAGKSWLFRRKVLTTMVL